MAIHVTVWNEYLHEKQFPEIASIYPKGIHGCIADFLQKAGMTVQTATLEEPEHGEQEILWVIDPSHPIVAGLDEKIMIPHEEMYGEHFDIPQPDEQVFISWFEGGEVFRSGCCWHRGKGKVFYFRPGHEAFPIYYQPEIQQVIVNAVKWATPIDFPPVTYGNPPAIMEVHGKLEHSIQGLHQPK